MKIKIIFLFIIIFSFAVCSIAVSSEDTVFQRAEEVYNSGNFLIAVQRFQSFIEKFPKSPLVTKAKFYIALCYRKEGEYKNAVRMYISIIERYSQKSDMLKAIQELSKIKSKEVKKYLEKKLLSPDIQIRAAVAQALGKVGNKKTIKKMVKALKKEKESSIQKKIVDSMSSIGAEWIKLSSLIELFKKGSEDLKISIVRLLSLVRKDRTVKFLSKELKTSSIRLRPYIIWALARIDPYLYGVRIEGKIEREKNWYFIVTEDKKKIELVTPGLTVGNNKKLEEFVGKKVILFGGKYEKKILYTQIYNKDLD